MDFFRTYCKDIKPVSNVSSPVEDFFAALQYNYSTCEYHPLCRQITFVTAFGTVGNFLDVKLGRQLRLETDEPMGNTASTAKN